MAVAAEVFKGTSTVDDELMMDVWPKTMAKDEQCLPPRRDTVAFSRRHAFICPQLSVKHILHSILFFFVCTVRADSFVFRFDVFIFVNIVV